MLALSEDALVLSLDSELTLVVLLLVELAVEEKFGNMVCLRDNKMSYVSLEKVIGENKSVDPKGELVMAAKAIGTCFGD